MQSISHLPFLFLIIMILLSGCEQSQLDVHCYDSLEEIDLSKVTMIDRGLSLDLIEGFDYKINKYFYLVVYNNSDDYILIPKGYLQKISRITDNNYSMETIEDEINRAAAHDLILAPQRFKGSPGSLLFHPKIQTPSESETIQVEVFGFEYRDGKICDRMYPAMIEVILSR